MPVFNGARFVRHAIESVLGQTFPDFELIISDNASTDGTFEICQEYARSDRRIRLSRQHEQVGAARNYNSTFRSARGAYFKWAAHDDVIAPTFLESCLRVLRSAPPGVVLCAPRTMLIDGSGREIGSYDHDLYLHESRPHERVLSLVRRLRLCNVLCGLMRSSVLRTTGLIGSYAASDKVLLTELAMRGRFWCVDEPLFLRRMHTERSRARFKEAADAARWFDPTSTRRVFQHQDLLLSFHQVRAAAFAPIAPHERGLCALILAAGGMMRIKSNVHRSLQQVIASAQRDHRSPISVGGPGVTGA